MDIKSTLQTQEFWIITVFFGVTINVVASLIVALAKKYFSRFNRFLMQRKEVEKIKYDNQLYYYSLSQSNYYEGLLELNHKKMYCIFNGVMACSMYLIALLFKDIALTVFVFGLITGVYMQIETLKSIIAHGRYSIILAEAKIAMQKSK